MRTRRRIGERQNASVGLSGIDVVVPVEAFVELPYWQVMETVGVPPHVSILYPWRASPLSAIDIQDVSNAIATVQPFSIFFDDVARFENGTVYVRVGEDGALSALMQSVWAAFPDTPPYGGEFTTPTPHLTLAKPSIEEADAAVAEVRNQLAQNLPLRFDVDRLSILEQLHDDTWRTTNEIEL